MTEKLTEEDVQQLEDLNLFRFDSYFYGPVFLVGLLFLIASFFIPYSGWKKIPALLPKDLDEYISRLIPYLIIAFIFIIPPILNWTIKKIELREGTKKIVSGEVIYRSDLLLQRKILIFKPFKVVIYKRGFHFSQLKAGDKVIMSLTYLGRVLSFTRSN